MTMLSTNQSLQLEIDMRVVAPGHRHRDLLTMYTALPPGDGFVFLDDHDPAALLGALQQQHWGDFDWYALEGRDAFWRIALSKRVSYLPRSRRISEVMLADHRRIEQMFLQLQELLLEADWPRALQYATFIAHGLQKHILIEERLLFPLLAHRALIYRQEELATFSREHWLIKGAAKNISHQLHRMLHRKESAEDLNFEVIQEIDALIAHFSTHREKEECYIYEATDLLLDQEQINELVKEFQELESAPL